MRQSVFQRCPLVKCVGYQSSKRKMKQKKKQKLSRRVIEEIKIDKRVLLEFFDEGI